VLFDAFWDDSFCRAIVSSMHDGSALLFKRGQVSFHATTAFPGPVVSGASTTVTRTVSERGRLFVNMGDRLVLKGYRWLLPGVHPELEMSRFLTETAKFTHMAQLAGTVEYTDGEGCNSTLAILEHYAENQGSAWAYTQDYLQRYLDECRTQQKRPIDSRHIAYMPLINTLGLRTAEFHRALAQDDADGAFGVEPITPEDLAEWVNTARAQMDEMYKLLEVKWPDVPKSAQGAANDLLSARSKFYRRITRLAAIHPEALKARCHGDYSLRQVWLSNNDFLITNYGGGPERAWRERRWKQSPLRDVAGMLFSFSEVAAAALEHVTDEYPESTVMLAQQADKWRALASADFLKSYRRAMEGNSLFPADTGVIDALVTLFMVEKAVASVSNALAQQSKSVDGTMQRLIRLMQRRR
jgi:maltose alpha-D-glucosyltransferase/alpha-amylase